MQQHFILILDPTLASRQATVATAGLVRMSRPGASPGHARGQRKRRWGWRPRDFIRDQAGSDHSVRDQPGFGKRSSNAPWRLRHPIARFTAFGGGSAGVGRTTNKKDIAKVCPSSDGEIEPVVVVPTDNARSGGGGGSCGRIGGGGGDGDANQGCRNIKRGLDVEDQGDHEDEKDESKSDEEGIDGDNHSDETFSVDVDVDVIDDVTCDEGFELGEVCCGWAVLGWGVGFPSSLEWVGWEETRAAKTRNIVIDAQRTTRYHGRVMRHNPVNRYFGRGTSPLGWGGMEEELQTEAHGRF